MGFDGQHAHKRVPGDPDETVDHWLKNVAGAEAAWIHTEVDIEDQLARDDDDYDKSSPERGLQVLCW